jgi:hypothetical protein
MFSIGFFLNMEFLHSEAHQKRVNGEWAQLFAELQSGIWSPEEYPEMVHNLAKSPPTKCLHHEYSPDWDKELPETAPEI